MITFLCGTHFKSLRRAHCSKFVVWLIVSYDDDDDGSNSQGGHPLHLLPSLSSSPKNELNSCIGHVPCWVVVKRPRTNSSPTMRMTMRRWRIMRTEDRRRGLDTQCRHTQPILYCMKYISGSFAVRRRSCCSVVSSLHIPVAHGPPHGSRFPLHAHVAHSVRPLLPTLTTKTTPSMFNYLV